MPEINCNADVFSIQNDADAPPDYDAVNVSSFRRSVYAYTLKAITILSLCAELQQIHRYLWFEAIKNNDTP